VTSPVALADGLSVSCRSGFLTEVKRVFELARNPSASPAVRLLSRRCAQAWPQVEFDASDHHEPRPTRRCRSATAPPPGWRPGSWRSFRSRVIGSSAKYC